MIETERSQNDAVIIPPALQQQSLRRYLQKSLDNKFPTEN
jgi:hypothetical protein